MLETLNLDKLERSNEARQGLSLLLNLLEELKSENRDAKKFRQWRFENDILRFRENKAVAQK